MIKISIRTLYAVIIVLAGLLSQVVYGATFKEGVHYIEIPFSDSLDTGKKVEVREFFWYGCPHCYRFEPVLANWLKNKPKEVIFVRTPAFLPKRNNHARAFYAMEALGKLEALHSKFFTKVQNHSQRLTDKDDIVKFMTSNGINKAEFLKTWDSFDVDRKVKEANRLEQKYTIHSVPNIVVDGRYIVGADSAGGQDKVLQVVNYLVKKIAKEKK